MFKFITILTLAWLAVAQIKIKQIKNPILPLFLNDAHISRNYYTFVKTLNISNLYHTLEHLTKEKIKIDNRLDKEITQMIGKQKEIGNIDISLKALKLKLDNLLPTKRHKRGWINIIGRASKVIFGTMSDEDEMRINNAIEILYANEKQMQKTFNDFMTITKSFSNKTTQTLKELQNVTSNLSDTVSDYQLLSDLSFEITRFDNILDEIINAKLFAQLNAVHDTILSIPDLNEILDHIKEKHPQNFIQLKYVQSYNALLDINVRYHKNILIYTIRFPLVDAHKYRLYHLYPIPVKSKIIIPYKPYLTLNATTEQYHEEDCIHIENKCIYNDHYEYNPQDCIADIIRGRHKTCSSQPIELQGTIIETLSPQHLVIIPYGEPQLYKRCPLDTGFVVLKNPSLLYIPVNCSIQIDEYVYVNNKTIEDNPTPVEIPEILGFSQEEEDFPIPIRNENLKELTKINAMIQKAHSMKIKEIQEDYHTSKWIVVLYAIVIILVIFVIYKIIIRFRETIHNSVTNIFKSKNNSNVPVKKSNEITLQEFIS